MNYLKKTIFVIITIFLTEINLNADTPHFIDFQKILNESTAGKKAQSELKTRLSQTVKKLDKTQKDLQEQEKQIKETKSQIQNILKEKRKSLSSDFGLDKKIDETRLG